MNKCYRQNAFMQSLPTGIPAGPAFAPFPGMPQQLQPFAGGQQMAMPSTQQMMTAPLSQQMPTVPMVQQAPGAPAIQQVPVIPVTQQFQTIPGPSTMTTDNILFTPGYMRTQIGRRVKVEFLLGTNMLVDREGTLEAVGADYIIIQEAETDDLLLCDLFSIKFVKFFY